jgi:hypothetical protein
VREAVEEQQIEVSIAKSATLLIKPIIVKFIRFLNSLHKPLRHKPEERGKIGDKAILRIVVVESPVIQLALTKKVGVPIDNRKQGVKANE